MQNIFSSHLHWSQKWSNLISQRLISGHGLRNWNPDGKLVTQDSQTWSLKNHQILQKEVTWQLHLTGYRPNNLSQELPPGKAILGITSENKLAQELPHRSFSRKVNPRGEVKGRSQSRDIGHSPTKVNPSGEVRARVWSQGRVISLSRGRWIPVERSEVIGRSRGRSILGERSEVDPRAGL